WTQGFNQVFRAHEVAHQWWGISVDYASYRDRWLSEGLAQFSGLWYAQTRLGSLDKYLGFLREYRGNLLASREHLGAMSLGHRVGTHQFGQYYSYGVYERGAWTMHMLRVLLLRLSDMNEDKFTNAMREFYTTYRGHPASTDDLRHVMEKYAGTDLGWFFSQWVDGNQIPTYRWAWHAEPGEGTQTRLQIRVRQTNVPDAFQMYVPVAVELTDGRTLKTRVKVTGPVTNAVLPPLPAPVKGVRFNELEGVLAEVSSEGW
ncbi:MAG TPA: M1 family aminopeptidase, partial [Gemmatimonadales bacterium]|nr:M1 family aminopeptidase [Gemmatimonadales bacterium]